ncbi:MAG: NPCBM/NEW2 domain-containing protein [Clostridiales bacterium]|nr:NPCBM/NEW2 domain-containing protein [Clostridiales bacterium]
MKLNFKNFKKLAFVPLAVVLLSVPVVAKQAVETAELTFRDIVVYVDGQVLDTSKTEPFIYNGTTYLPLRTVAEALGKDVTWVAETSTIYLGDMPSVYVETDTPLEEMYTAGNTYEKIQYIKKGKSGTDNKGNEYSSGAVFTCKSAKIDNVNSAEYTLNGKFSTFSDTIALPYSEKESGKTKTVEFYGDGELLYSSGEFEDDTDPEPFEIDISRVAVFQIKTTGSGSIGIYESMFYAK